MGGNYSFLNSALRRPKQLLSGKKLTWASSPALVFVLHVKVIAHLFGACQLPPPLQSWPQILPANKAGPIANGGIYAENVQFGSFIM